MPTSSEMPYPPPDLANRVLSTHSDHFKRLIAFEVFGASTKEMLLELLPDGYDLSGRKVLDFGCGVGRTLRHFVEEAENAEFWGVDIDEPSVDWLRETFSPPLNVAVCDPLPPLQFGDSEFDLAWAISVFTHLPGSSADWLLELHRVLKPGGLLMASYMGEINSETIAGEPWDEDRIGMNVLHHDQSWDDGGPMVLMSDWWVREHWGRAFEIVELAPGSHNQTWALLRKRDVKLTAEELMAPGDDPREWRALRHNLVQLQREIDGKNAANAALREEFESSLSWKVTRPLRAARSRRRKDV